jgi:long-chain acyl-CoA synthetase
MGTIPGLLLAAADHHRKPNAFQFKQGGQWVQMSTEEFVARVEEVFHGLRALGIREGDRVAILSENRVEWAICDCAAQSMGSIVVPIYPSSAPAQVETLLQDSGARLVFVSSIELLEKLIVSRKRLHGLVYIVAFDPKIYQPGILRLETIHKIGREVSTEEQPGAFRRMVDAQNPENVATIIYTSGTTGVAKGVMLTHRNLVSNVRATLQVLRLTSQDIELSFLPLSHIFQRHVDYVALSVGATVVYAESPALAGVNMAEVGPTFVAGVPRFFEKIRTKILLQGRTGSGMRKVVFNWALEVGLRATHTKRESLQYRFADRIVFRKIRGALGGRLRWLASAGAALDQQVGEFFLAIGLPILEGYGLTETSPVVTLTDPAEVRIGSVGKPVGDVEVRIASDGEILVKGPNVMKGYFRRPEETAEALRDGWFHTGDLGELTAEGYLRIIDRKKDLIVTSSGKNVAPQMIENRLKLVPYFDNVMVVGDGRHFISALIVPNMDAIVSYARQNNLPFRDPRDLLQRHEIYDLAMREIDLRCSDLSPHEHIRKVAFIGQGFSIDTGELTPTLKVRRSIVEEKFRDQIDNLYAA